MRLTYDGIKVNLGEASGHIGVCRGRGRVGHLMKLEVGQGQLLGVFYCEQVGRTRRQDSGEKDASILGTF